MKWVGKNTIIQVLSGIVAIEGYLQFEHVVGGLHCIAYFKSQLDAPILLTL